MVRSYRRRKCGRSLKRVLVVALLFISLSIAVVAPAAPKAVLPASTTALPAIAPTGGHPGAAPIRGWVTGNVTPVNATVTLDSVPISVGALGGFNATATPGAHVLNASLGGYDPFSTSFDVVVGKGAHFAIVLNVTGISTGPQLTWSGLELGLSVDAALVLGLALAFTAARRRRSEAPIPPDGASLERAPPNR